MNRFLWLVVGSFLLGFGIAFIFQQTRINNIKNEYNAFVDRTRFLGEQAKDDARIKEVFYKESKERVDNENKKTITSLRADVSRLRKQYTGASIVPRAAAYSRSPDLSCFDRGELTQAVDNLTHGLWRIAQQGDESAESLNSAREWAKEVDRD